MTIDEFEQWFEGFKKSVPMPGLGLYFNNGKDDAAIPLDRLINTANVKNLYFPKIADKTNAQVKIWLSPIPENINKVEPLEDRDFLLLKYSEYL